MPERQKRVTLKDVADYCGLSRSLVAFIISNSGYRNSTPENRRKVAEAVKALNYRPNTAARELRARKSSTIGVAMPMSGTGIYGNMALELQREIADTETKIQAARQFYNSVVMALNTQIDQFPSNIIARMFNITPEKLFEMNESEKATPTVKF